MALLDFTRFGIKEEDILNNAFDYIIGFDLGHGEIAASYWNLRDTRPVPADLVLTAGGATKIYSAFFRRKDGSFITGVDELMLPKEEGELYSCFKVRPSRLRAGEMYEGTNIEKKRLMQRMLLLSLQHIQAYNPDLDFKGKGILAVGCPSSDDWKSEENSRLYAKILGEKVSECGLDLSVVIMPESRASLLKIYKERTKNKDFKQFMEQFHNGVMADDHGSSTLDSTAIDFTTNTLCEESIPLGGAMIEDTMLRLFLKEKGYRKEDIADCERVKLEMRKAKEIFYLSPKSSIRVYVDFKDGNDATLKLSAEFMHRVTHECEVAYSTDSCPVKRGTWCALHREFLEKCKDEWLKVTAEREFEGIVLLTGGASHMDFTVENVKAVFPKAVILKDQAPSYCVSRGLSYAVRTDLEAFRLIREAKEKIAQAIKNDMATLKGMIGEQLTPLVFDYMKRKLLVWANEDSDLSLDGILKKITADFNVDCRQEVERITKDAFVSYLNKSGESGIKSIIVKTVNDLFESIFPGKLSERSIDRFSVDAKEWEYIIEAMATKNAWDVKDTLIDKLDIEGTIERALKYNFVVALALLPFYFLACFIDYLFDTKFSNQLDEAYTEKRYKVCTKEERKKIYDKLVNKEEENKKVINQSLSQSCIPVAKEEQIAGMIVGCLDASINKAVDNVSLYF